MTNSSFLLFAITLSGLLLSMQPVAGQRRLPNAADSSSVLGACRRCVVLTEQQEHAIVIADIANHGKIYWFWQAADGGIPPDKQAWFDNPDDAKPVYNRRYLLINASGGGVALVRIADKKAVFYAHAGRNPHSSELLPDGNIVTASSTDNRLVVFHVDTLAASGPIYKKVIPLPFAHNVVWDRKRQLLWSAAKDHLYTLRYNFDFEKPDLIRKDSFPIPGTDAHDLFPVFGKDCLWLTTPDAVYQVDASSRKITPAGFRIHAHIKSVSSGPDKDWSVIVMQPRTEWWSDRVLDQDGQVLLLLPDTKIYKARWFLPNPFSYASKQ